MGRNRKREVERLLCVVAWTAAASQSESHA